MIEVMLTGLAILLWLWMIGRVLDWCLDRFVWIVVTIIHARKGTPNCERDIDLHTGNQ